MDISENTAIFYPVNGREIKVEGAEYTQHSSTGEHYVKMTNDVKRVVK
jgi:hypothetical protein